MIKSLKLIMIIKKRNEVFACFTMRTDKSRFRSFAVLENGRQLRNISPTLGDVAKFKEKRIVKCRINPKSLGHRAVPPHKKINFLLASDNFAKGKKVSFAKRLGKFADRIPKNFNHIRFNMFRRVDPE